MNSWLNRLLWLSTIVLFVGLSISKAVVSLGVGLFVVSAILYWITSKKQPNWRVYKPLLALCIFYLFYLFSIAWSDNINEAIDQIARQHAFVSIPICCWILSDWLKTRIPKLMKVFIGVCSFHACITILLFFLPEVTVENLATQFDFLQSYPKLTDRVKFGLYTPFLERLNFAYLIGFAIFYLIYKVLCESLKSWYVLQLIPLLVAFLLIGARGAQLAFLIAFTCGTLSFMIDWLQEQGLSKEVYQQKLVSGITILLIGLIALPYLAYRNIPAVQKRYAQMQWEMRLINNGEYLNEEYQYFTSLSRIRAWTNAYTIASNNPIIGVGLGDFDEAMIIENNSYADKVPVHNQNFLLYLWASCGILALSTWLFGLAYYLRSYYLIKTKYLRHLVLSYIVFILIACMIDAFLKYHIGSVSVTLFLSVMFLLNINQEREVG